MKPTIQVFLLAILSSPVAVVNAYLSPAQQHLSSARTARGTTSFLQSSTINSTTESVSFSLSSNSKSPPPIPSPVDVMTHPLIQKANEFIYTKSGFYSPYDASWFADDFVFRGPYIGPLNKRDYLDTMDAFEIYNAIPDISPNAFGFSVDPRDENRVWFLVRNTGTFTGKNGLKIGDSFSLPPNGAVLDGCPETHSIIFDPSTQKVKHLSVGYVADRFQGNTQGAGAAVGIFKAVGFPFPSPGIGLRVAQWLGTEVAPIGPKSYSKKEEVPSWWKDDQVASEGYV